MARPLAVVAGLLLAAVLLFLFVLLPVVGVVLAVLGLVIVLAAGGLLTLGWRRRGARRV